jgi:hypothetical protein
MAKVESEGGTPFLLILFGCGFAALGNKLNNHRLGEMV